MAKTQETLLVTGACGQLGTELTAALAQAYGANRVIATDIRQPQNAAHTFERFEVLDITQGNEMAEFIQKHGITHIYHLAALLSATGEQKPMLAWQVNMQGWLNVLEVSREVGIQQIYFPSSIAAFGADTPRENTPQTTVMNPGTVYGISKYAGELWANYYCHRYGLDVRSLRYPGLISYSTPPGGGTTDYAVDIFYKALETGHYTCFLDAETRLPMMYMPDAIKATLQLMQADQSAIKVRTSYNLTAFSFTPAEIAQAIRQHIPAFEIQYAPDFRQAIADSWPATIDDSQARMDWGWQPDYDLAAMVKDMIANLQQRNSQILAKV